MHRSNFAHRDGDDDDNVEDVVYKLHKIASDRTSALKQTNTHTRTQHKTPAADNDKFARMIFETPMLRSVFIIRKFPCCAFAALKNIHRINESTHSASQLPYNKCP